MKRITLTIIIGILLITSVTAGAILSSVAIDKADKDFLSARGFTAPTLSSVECDGRYCRGDTYQENSNVSISFKFAQKKCTSWDDEITQNKCLNWVELTTEEKETARLKAFEDASKVYVELEKLYENAPTEELEDKVITINQIGIGVGL